MTRSISKGVCAFCQATYSKSAMRRHLETCKQRALLDVQARQVEPGHTSRSWHVLVEGRFLPIYWLHLDIAGSTTLAQLDQFLRTIWLECCGHLSAFTIENERYSSDEALQDWMLRQNSMHIPLDEVVRLGQRIGYEYDFGSTTELVLKVLSVRTVETGGKPIRVLARNEVPFARCDGCGKAVLSTCIRCTTSGEGGLCASCARTHACGQEMLRPRINSPREGVCGYTGPHPSFA